ncbi:YebW family protein [Lonsdalea quercina]
MFVLIIFVCYVGGSCEDLVTGIYETETQCLKTMGEQRIRNGGCYPIEDFIDGFWRPAQEYRDMR